MSLDVKASDWQVFGRVSVAGGAGLGAGLYVFAFYSETASVSATFSFVGLGVGEGGNLGGLGVPEDVGPITAWTSLECDEPFSVWDLNGGWGRITYLGGAVGAGYSAIFITASPRSLWTMRHYFQSQYVGGISVLSVGGGGQVIGGRWRFKRVSNNIPASPSDGLA